jgi:hypothetical protein
LLVALTLGSAGFAQAQATIGISGAASVLTKTGYTELIGAVTFTVASGTTVAGTLEFFVPNTTFTSTAGVTLNGTGGLASASITAIAPTNGVVIISVPAGAGPGASLTLSGLRISAVGSSSPTLNAAISSSGNSIFAGQNTVSVVRGLADGLVVDASAGSTVSVAGSVIINTPGTIKVSEGWTHSFSSAIGVAGQTAPTQIIFQVVGLPDNVSLTFPATVTSDTGDGATIATAGGGAVVLTNQSSTNRVVYLFTDSATSANALDSFSIMPVVGILGPAGIGTAYIQVALGPIGAAVPSDQYPSTDVPRFVETFLPPLPTIQPTLTTFSLPVPAGITTETFSLANTTTGGAIVTARARQEDGTLTPNISNAATVTLTSRQTLSLSLSDLFGANASAASISAVEFSTVTSGLVSNGIASFQNGRTGTAAPADQVLTYLPFDRQTSADTPAMVVQNATDNAIPTQFTLWSSSGTSIKTVSVTIPGHGGSRQDLLTLFGAANVPLSGYVGVRGTSGSLRAILINHPAGSPEGILSVAGSASTALSFPFFAFGGGFDTTLTLINSSSTLPAIISITPYASNGTALSQPFSQTIAPMQRQDFDFAAIFSSSSGVTSGYFSISLSSSVITLFGSLPTVFGVVRISTGSSATWLPLVLPAGTEFFMTPGAEGAANYTGLSVLNPGSAPASVTIEAYSSGGTLLGTVPFTLQGGISRIQLLRELIPQSLNQDSVLLHITATSSIQILGFRGALNGSELIILAGETLP